MFCGSVGNCRVEDFFLIAMDKKQQGDIKMPPPKYKLGKKLNRCIRKWTFLKMILIDNNKFRIEVELKQSCTMIIVWWERTLVNSNFLFFWFEKKYTPLLADLCIFSNELEILQNLVNSWGQTVAKSFNYTYRYIDDVVSLNNIFR